MPDSAAKDLKFAWHPFTHLKYAPKNINIVSAKGAHYFDEHKKKYIDGISSWWVNLHGHSHPYLIKKINQQLKKNAHSIFSGFTHPQAIKLAERLVSILPGQQSKIFFSDDGSTAVEVAIKMALQFFHNKNYPDSYRERTKIIALENAYHGDTFGGMSVGARNAFNNAFSSLLFDVVHIPVPFKENRTEVLNKLKATLIKNKCAAFIYEPVIQGAGGMVMYNKDVLDEMVALCKKAGVICIADEVMTGFGRTGKLFASEYLKNKPDIICLSKGLTGGIMPMGVTSCVEKIYKAFITDDKTKTFFHGHSYTANPLSCSAANASLDLLQKKETLKNISKISEAHEKFRKKISGNKQLKSVRCLGTIIAFELKSKENSGYLHSAAEKISEFFIQKGIILRPLGNIFYILPPYCIKMKDLKYIYSEIENFLKTC
ncbi:MAG: adenosylmethionine--8-amino-7-oxononanoate transaminase [Bacteroidia bacterium]|nr:adenosylmethionine--8-amino-7-oxononanoate transaminase [Bacteroidia bacterium]